MALPSNSSGVFWAVEGSNLRPTGYEPPPLIFCVVTVAPKYELHQPVPKAPAQQQPVVKGRGDVGYPIALGFVERAVVRKWGHL